MDLYALARRAADSFAPELAAKGLHCAVEGEPVTVPGDEGRLYQVAVNLLSNAVKYTGEGGHISVKVSDTPTHGVLTVTDDGIGIPEADRQLIFERFYRTDRSRSRKTGGAGIGLTIVRSIVRSHNGTVTVDSQEGEGSRFTVSLPKGEAV